MIDRFRKTGRPLLEVLTDPNLVFMDGLRLFRRRSIYANIVNEIDTIFYTTGISKADPFEHLQETNLNYIQGYEPTIVDWAKQPEYRPPLLHQPSLLQRLDSADLKRSLVYIMTLLLGLLLSGPLLIIQAYLSIRSSRRIIQHKRGRSQIRINDYRIPLLVDGIQRQADHLYESLNSALPTQHLPESVAMKQILPAENTASKITGPDNPTVMANGDLALCKKLATNQSNDSKASFTPGIGHAPVLALTQTQFAMIEELDALGLRKFPVHIHKTVESHAAIIVRVENAEFSEGKVVIRHWLQEEFIP